MRVTGLPLLVVLFLCLPSWSQQIPSSQPAAKDPQAITILNQALGVAGGIPALKVIADYTATGKVTYHWNQDTEGSVTIQGKGGGQLRIDANLPAGTRSLVLNEGQTSLKAESGTILQFPPQLPPGGAIPSSDAFPYQTPAFASSLIFPYGQLLAVLNNPIFAISYRGVVQLDGRSVHDIQIKRTPPNSDLSGFFSEYHTTDVFVDATSLQIAMTQDSIPRHVIHQIRYSAYASVNGLLVPFSIGEEMGGQHTWEIQLSQISFNGGLQDSTFVLQ